MTIVDKIFALRGQFPFSRLRAEELLIIATAATEREYGPGRVIATEGGTLHHLFVRVSGDLVDNAGIPAHPVVGTTVLLTGCAVPYTLRAGPQGYRGLTIPRGKLLTIIYECPLLLVGFFEMPIHVPGARPAQPPAP